MQYDSQVAVKDASFTVSEGDYLCIVGENGSGKSTLVKGILGLMSPSSGSITYSGIHPTEIGYLPQQTIIQRDFPASVMEVVLSGCIARKGLWPFYSSNDKGRAAEHIRKLGISQLSQKSYRDLSGGQQQRVLLARALCATEKLLLLDEPVAGLDPLVTAEFYHLIEELNHNHGVTVIMISHDILSAVKYATSILHMDKVVRFFGSTSDYTTTNTFRRMIGGDASA